MSLRISCLPEASVGGSVKQALIFFIFIVLLSASADCLAADMPKVISGAASSPAAADKNTGNAAAPDNSLDNLSDASTDASQDASPDTFGVVPGVPGEEVIEEEVIDEEIIEVILRENEAAVLLEKTSDEMVSAAVENMPKAADGSADHASGDHTNWKDLIWRLINFALFIGIIWWAGGKKIKTFLSGRREAIASDLKQLQEARDKAEKDLRDLTAHIAHAEEERARIIEENKLAAEALAERIVSAAKLQAEEILRQARLSAENEARTMEKELRLALADQIIEAAKDSLTKRLGAAEHDRLISSALEKVVLQ